MQTSATTSHAAETGADTVVVGVIEGEKVAHDVDGALQALVDSGEAKARFKHLALGHAGGKRWILVGLGARDELTQERLRVAAAVACDRAREIGTERLCWELPHRFDDHPARAVVEGTLLAAYRFDRFKSGGDDDEPPARIESLVVCDHDDRAGAVARATIVAEAVNGARDLQNTPANVLTPTALAEHARGIERRIGRGRNPRGDRRPRDGGLRCRRAGHTAGARPHHAALRARRCTRAGPRARRQGRDVRQRRASRSSPEPRWAR